MRDPAELCRLLQLPAEYQAPARRAAETFGLLVPREYLARIRPADPGDPLLRQVLPLDAELQPVPGFGSDPVGEAAAVQAPGLLHKYRGRALMVLSGACAVHCRYCFRRQFPYHEAPRSLAQWEPALAAVAADATLREVILSGGDPLSRVDGWLAALVERLAAIAHLRRLRVHTRLPIVVPQRVTDEMLTWLTATRLTPIVVVHVNHAQEIDSAVAAALSRLVDRGIPVLNQAVLLRDVNDSPEALRDLCQRLVDLRVLPYYLHQLDRVSGAAHFEVPIDRGRRLVRQLRRELPGYAVPRYVQEKPGAAAKRPLL